MKVWFHEFHTEAHRKWRRGVALVEELEKYDIECTLHLDSTCDAAICGAFWLADAFDAEMYRANEFRHERGAPLIKKVYLCWDLYSVNLRALRPGIKREEVEAWHRYVANLSKADAVVVPSSKCADQVVRTSSYGNVVNERKLHVVKAACDPWWESWPREQIKFGTAVVDVMRKYGDPNDHLVKRACDLLNLPYVEMNTSLPVDEFRRTVAEARVLASTYKEASTGGMTLLEGYALGKPVILSNSPYNGGRDYFLDRATYFNWQSFDEFVSALKHAYIQAHPDPTGPFFEQRRKWVRENYTDKQMAQGLAQVLKGLS